MASTDPHVVGVAKRCITCPWMFRCPIAQQQRVQCRACES